MMKKLNAGYECGLSIKNFNDIKVGDIIEGFEEIEIKRNSIIIYLKGIIAGTI